MMGTEIKPRIAGSTPAKEEFVKKLEIVMRGMNDSMDFIKSFGVTPTDFMMKDILSCGSFVRNALISSINKSNNSDSTKEELISMFDKVHKYLFDLGCYSPIPLHHFYYDAKNGVGVNKDVVDKYLNR